MADPRNNAHTIPALFVRQDTRVDTADEFVNVHDEQTFWLNHNKLCANNLRRTVFASRLTQRRSNVTNLTSTSGSAAEVTASNYESFDSYYGVFDGAKPSTIIDEEIWLSPFVSTLTLEVRAFKKTLTDDPGDPILYPVVCRPDQEPQLDWGTSIAITSTSLAEYSCATISVPPDLRSSAYSSHRLVRFALIIAGKIETSAGTVVASGTSVQAEYHFVDVGFSVTPGEVLYPYTNPACGVRMVTDVVSLGGGNYRVYVDRPWKTLPKTAVDAFATRNASGVYITTMSLYENPTTDLDEIEELRR